MTRDKQIDEMAKGIVACPYIAAPIGTDKYEGGLRIAEYFIDKGYRKSTDLAREIFEEIENAHEECIHIDPSTNIGYLLQSQFKHKLAELKKKYTEENL